MKVYSHTADFIWMNNIYTFYIVLIRFKIHIYSFMFTYIQADTYYEILTSFRSNKWYCGAREEMCRRRTRSSSGPHPVLQPFLLLQTRLPQSSPAEHAQPHARNSVGVNLLPCQRIPALVATISPHRDLKSTCSLV